MRIVLKNLMKRKLIAQGAGGFTFYVPKKWVDSRGLGAGDEIEIEEIGNNLVVSSFVKDEKEIVLSFKDSEMAQVSASITHIYRLGYGKIIVKGSSKILRIVNSKVLPLLMGFEITSKGSKKIVLENLSEPSEQKFEIMLRRVFFILKEMHERNSQELIRDKLEEDLDDLRLQLDRICYFLKRSLSRKLVQLEMPQIYWELLTYLMAIGHGQYYLHDYMKNEHVPRTTRVDAQKYLEKVGNYFDLLSDALYKKDVGAISKINSLKKTLVFEEADALIASKTKGSPLLSKIQYVARMIQLCSGSVYYLLLDLKK
jgi:phosphate uptake regulator